MLSPLRKKKLNMINYYDDTAIELDTNKKKRER